MGIKLYTYVGPFIEISAPSILVKIDLCPRSNDCPNSTENFCFKCGIQIVSRYETIKQNLLEFINLDEYCDRLYVFKKIWGSDRNSEFNTYWIVSNIKNDLRKFEIDEDDNNHVIYISPKTIENELQWFETEFQYEIDQIKSRLVSIQNNSVNMKLSWGIISDWY